MIAHVVLFKPRPDLTAEERQGLGEALSTALSTIPSIRRVRVGRRVTQGLRPYEAMMRVNYEYAAILEFDDEAGLRAYMEHPAHEALGARFFAVFEEALMYDYDFREGEAAIRHLLAPDLP